ncbi:hypothetical protein BGZ49_004347, partial [Haplosporangium sp. Z 27]
MFRALSSSSTVVASLAQHQTRLQAAAAFHSSSVVRNNSSNLTELLATLRTGPKTGNSSSSSNSNNSTINKSSGLFGSSRSGFGNANRTDLSLFGLNRKANTTSNPIHLDITHVTEGRSFRVPTPSNVDQTYRRLRTALNQSNIKRELRLRRYYETGHTRMRREKQEQNKRLFGAMVKKKIELIKLMKIRG